MRRTFIILIAVSLILCSVTLLTEGKNSTEVWSEKGVTVVLDAGHGGEDGGAISDSGVMEKNINLEIAKKCESIFKLLGINVLMTRESDTSLDDGKGETIAARKAEDIRRRAELADKIGGVLVSIHMNSFSDEKYWGTQCFYSPYSGSRELAENIQKICLNVCENNTRQAKLIDKSVYILNHTNVPAVIVECGFLSNTEETKKLIDDDYQKKMSAAICIGTMKYINGKE